ncbi:hypothetical protein QCA50_008489 [Cerrena zonata]|uniref:Uncharacterized protein n=1 Tax=Cerrena zonata TaxID=2478898 RepID=A0AAW0GDB7_9APHY
MEDTVTSEHHFLVVVFESTQWLLKAFIDDSNFFAYSEEPGFEEHQSIAQFKRERDSYAHFRHYKIADGLSKEQIFDLAEKFDCWKNRKDAPYELPVLGILTEYFPDAAFPSISNVNFALAESAMRGLCNIHGCYVLHNDPATRNCLVVSEDRVVWVDFDRSCTPGDPDVTGPIPARSSYWSEFLRVWVLIYNTMLPGKYLGKSTWQW